MMSKINQFKLSAKLFVAISITAVIGLIASFIVINTIVRDSVYDNIIGITQRDKIIYAGEIDNWFEVSMDIIDILATTFQHLGIDYVRDVAAPFIDKYDFVTDIFVGFGDGHVRAGSGIEPPAGFDATTRPWYINARNAGGAVVMTDPYINVSRGILVTTVSRFIIMPDGMEAVVNMDIQVQVIFDMLNAFDVTGGGYMFLIGMEGGVISHPHSDFEITADGPVIINTIERYNNALTGIGGATHGIARFNNLDGVHSYFMTAPLPATGWTLVSVIPVDATERPVLETLMIIMVTFFVVLAVLFTVIMLYIPRLVIRPVKNLANIVTDFSQGKLDVNFDMSNLSKDEIGMMAHNVYSLVDVIKSMVDDLSTVYHAYSVQGNSKYRIDADKYQNSFKEMVGSINQILDEEVENITSIVDTVNGISEGNFDVQIREMPGDFAFQTQAIRAVITNLKGVSAEVTGMIEAAAVKGKLDFKTDADNYKGDWRNIMVGLNDIAKAVNAPLVEISGVMASLSKGGFDKKITGSYSGDFLELSKATNETIDAISGYLAEMRNVLTAISQGDLTQSIDSAIAAKFSERSFAEITNAINGISRQLHKTMSEISAASGQVLSGANQISNSATELASGAQEQASSVEELNASIDLINQQTQHNADNALTANELSQKSSVNAQEGNDAMKQTVEAMAQIKESSNSISKIINTIQDIAFQTNLLALNASVEAARAGEHGKGFAVVADEVRTLAGRSQDAANETTTLIQDSINRVENGASIAETTSTSLDSIVTSAGEVSEIINGITASSKEQAEAIKQIGDGLEQISKVTQSNSAVSEETAAAAEELNSQAEVLRQLVSYFKL